MVAQGYIAQRHVEQTKGKQSSDTPQITCDSEVAPCSKVGLSENQ